jgi:hypothetical protein
VSDFEGLIRRTSSGLGSRQDAPQSATVSRDALADAATLKKRAAVRSTELLAAIARLDAEPSRLASEQILEWIREHYAERGGGHLLGLFGRCYLGPPYVDHVMTVTGQICEHFTAADTVPPMYGPARSLASNPAYEFVEVYSDGVTIPVRTDGRPVL